MTYVRTFLGFAPPARTDDVPFSIAAVQEASTRPGPFSTISTYTVASYAADDPPSLDFTTNDATLDPSGWYRISWVDGDGAVFNGDAVYFPSDTATGAYANLGDVSAHAPLRSFTASTRPTADGANQFLTQTALELDGVLRNAGYQLPVPTTATAALAHLRYVNAYGAYARIEEAAPTGKEHAADKATTEYRRLLAQLDPQQQGPTISLDAPRDAGETYARSDTLATMTYMTADQEL